MKTGVLISILANIIFLPLTASVLTNDLPKRVVGGIQFCKKDDFGAPCYSWICEEENLSKCMVMDIPDWNDSFSWKPDQGTKIEFYLSNGCKGDPWTTLKYPDQFNHGSAQSQYWAETEAVRVFRIT